MIEKEELHAAWRLPECEEVGCRERAVYLVYRERDYGAKLCQIHAPGWKDEYEEAVTEQEVFSDQAWVSLFSEREPLEDRHEDEDEVPIYPSSDYWRDTL